LALVGVLAFFSRRRFQADELEILINRQALVFAFYAALSGLFVLHLLQSAGFVPVYAWTTKQLLYGLVLLMVAGILWSKRRYR
jgi:H+/Cl- antiporter ClcA